MISEFKSWLWGVALGCALVLLPPLIVHKSFDFLAKHPQPTELQDAAEKVCADLLLMHQQGSNNAIEALGIVRCALLEKQ